MSYMSACMVTPEEYYATKSKEVERMEYEEEIAHVYFSSFDRHLQNLCDRFMNRFSLSWPDAVEIVKEKRL